MRRKKRRYSKIKSYVRFNRKNDGSIFSRNTFSAYNLMLMIVHMGFKYIERSDVETILDLHKKYSLANTSKMAIIKDIEALETYRINNPPPEKEEKQCQQIFLLPAPKIAIE